jgi:hypothetical protein
MRTRLLMFVAVVGLVTATAAEAADTPETLSEVTVTAQHLTLDWGQRNALVQRAATFVYGIQGLENDSGVPRWQTPLCPLVWGLPPQQSEFVLARISEIARAAGVRLAGEQCQANLFIFVTAHPKELLQAMENRYFAVSFGNATPSEVEEFIDTPRPIKVWHNTYREGDRFVGIGLPPAAQVLGGSISSPPVYSTGGTGGLGPNRLGDLGWTFGPTYVVVDPTRLRGVSQQQFADYVAMVGLAKIKTNAHLGDTPTILKLFDSTPAAALAGISNWDLAFLKVLYHPELSLAQERSLIALRMVRDMVP